MSLPAIFLAHPFAHRGLHDRAVGVIENSSAAFDAAVEAGYGIELDVQMSRDGVPVVFHDDMLDRLTSRRGPVADLTAQELETVALDGSTDTILPLPYVLERIGGRVPVLVEIKDQGARDGFPAAVGHAIAAATGPIAVMSFNPSYIHGLEGLNAPRGLTTCAAEDYGSDLPAETRSRLARIADWGPGLSFVSHDHRHLEDSRIADLKAEGASILCWTIRSKVDAGAALKLAHQITFEGFRPD
ncbi:Glycerophosphoryl diester phosphodiesterase [Palleronia marisminoris]|uniref:Putative glycerophosphoryl diester phosphodiesterase 1 n=1 Tax=Palleronia marisminoris TaxID=315423 RepID=A0A1Y5SZH5_9RHOB|nr:glycerophosphodiester phosphodiesterase family protein [Palleronia marisminoris]SFH08388.1 Glycerophosphoryl diester phosphodiesterase [Palleronia marisminoris]SLN52199.1 putative glycerophosphoryl diester phosphodiesterase 1 [Palleronia marisminoris]